MVGAEPIPSLSVRPSPGCQLLVYPGAFNMTTGPAHWELLQRGRSEDRTRPGGSKTTTRPQELMPRLVWSSLQSS